jgi:hypothetical protein
VAAVVFVALLGACSSDEPPRATFPAPSVGVTTRPTASAPTAAPTTAAPPSTAPPQWAARSFDEADPAGARRRCVEVTVGTTIASTCLTLPGVSSWTVAGAHFVLAAGDIALSDGTSIRADAGGIAIGLLPSRVLPNVDGKDDCSRDALAPALAEHYPGSTVAWVPSRCAGGAASVSATLADRSEITALVAQANDGHWEVFATFRPPVHCALLDVRSRDFCKLLRYSD